MTEREEAIARFMEWKAFQIILYGDPYLEWWRKYGQKSFMDWAFKRGLKYEKEPERASLN